MQIWAGVQQNQKKWPPVYPAKTQTSFGIHPVWSAPEMLKFQNKN